MYQQKRAFWASFGWFLGHYNPKSSPIFTKFLPVMQWSAKYHICYGFWYNFENSKNGAKKPIFSHFLRGFPSTTSEPLCATPKSFVKWKDSWRYTILASFIFLAFVVLKLYISKVSRTSKKGHFGLLLGGFWDITRPNHVGFVPNFYQRCSP